MTLTEYLEHLTDNNWHTLRELIELERDTLDEQQNTAATLGMTAATKALHAARELQRLT
jgi:hypothetical protein